MVDWVFFSNFSYLMAARCRVLVILSIAHVQFKLLL